MGTWMIARYRSECIHCEGAILPGHKIIHLGAGHAYHEACGKVDTSAFKAPVKT